LLSQIDKIAKKKKKFEKFYTNCVFYSNSSIITDILYLTNIWINLISIVFLISRNYFSNIVFEEKNRVIQNSILSNTSLIQNTLKTSKKIAKRLQRKLENILYYSLNKSYLNSN